MPQAIRPAELSDPFAFESIGDQAQLDQDIMNRLLMEASKKMGRMRLEELDKDIKRGKSLQEIIEKEIGGEKTEGEQRREYAGPTTADVRKLLEKRNAILSKIAGMQSKANELSQLGVDDPNTAAQINNLQQQIAREKEVLAYIQQDLQSARSGIAGTTSGTIRMGNIELPVGPGYTGEDLRSMKGRQEFDRIERALGQLNQLPVDKPIIQQEQGRDINQFLQQQQGNEEVISRLLKSMLAGAGAG